MVDHGGRERGDGPVGCDGFTAEEALGLELGDGGLLGGGEEDGVLVDR